VYVLTSSSVPFSVAESAVSATRSMNVSSSGRFEVNSTVVVERNVFSPG
jgi:hypothetical protein